MEDSTEITERPRRQLVCTCSVHGPQRCRMHRHLYAPDALGYEPPSREWRDEGARDER